MSDPITFNEPSWALFDVEANAVCMTKWGNLAIFNTQGFASIEAQKLERTTGKHITVMQVRIYCDAH